MTRARKCVLLGVYANIGAGKSSPLLSFQFPFFLFFLEGKARYWSCFSCLLLTLLKIGENIFKHNRKRNLPNFTMPTSPSTGQSSALDAASSKSRITRLGYINSPPSLISPVFFHLYGVKIGNIRVVDHGLDVCFTVSAAMLAFSTAVIGLCLQEMNL